MNTLNWTPADRATRLFWFKSRPQRRIALTPDFTTYDCDAQWHRALFACRGRDSKTTFKVSRDTLNQITTFVQSGTAAETPRTETERPKTWTNWLFHNRIVHIPGPGLEL